MPGAFGPILTTGVALSAAVVVVTNPVTAPHADVRIPAAQAQVSTASGQAVDMLDEDFINAVAPGPTGSTNPLAILKDLVKVLVADAAEVGKSTVLRAFIAGASVVAPNSPELTSVTLPYVVPPAPETLPNLPDLSAMPWTAVPGPVSEELRPVVEQALTAIIADAGDVTDPGVIAAAFMAGAALAAEESPIAQDLRRLVESQFQPALRDAKAAAITRPAIGTVILDAVKQHLPTPPPGDFTVLPRRDSASGTGLLTGGAPMVGGDVTETVNRPARQIADRSLPPLLSSVSDVKPPVLAAISPKRPIGSPHHATATGPGGSGPLASAIKARLDRVRN